MRFKKALTLFLSLFLIVGAFPQAIFAQDNQAQNDSKAKTTAVSGQLDQNYVDVIKYCQDIINGKVKEGTNWDDPKDVLYMNIGYSKKDDVYYWLGDLTGDDQDELVISKRHDSSYLYDRAYYNDQTFVDNGEVAFIYTINNGNLEIVDYNMMPPGGMELKWITKDNLIGTHENDSSYSMDYPYYKEDLTYSDANGNFVEGLSGHKKNPQMEVSRDYANFTFHYIDNRGNEIDGKPELNLSQAREVVNKHSIVNILQHKLMDFKGNLEPDLSDLPEDSVPIYRLYNTRSTEHLYTSDFNEVNSLYNSGDWNYEGVGWAAPKTGDPVYRLYNPALADHLFTTDENEVKELSTKAGWTVDNDGEPLFYSEGTVPIYRLYNQGTLRHLLTKDEKEYNELGSKGWDKEDVALYALS